MNLSEELLLIALQDEKGTVRPMASIALDYGLAGALLIEIIFADKLLVRDKKLYVTDTDPIGEGLLDAALTEIYNSKRGRSAEYWVNRLTKKLKQLRTKVAETLVKSDVLEKRSGRRFLVLPATRYVLRDAAVELEIKEKMRDVVLGGEAPDPRCAALINLVQACELQNEVFSKEERRDAKKRMKEISVPGSQGQVVTEAVKAIKDGIIAAAATAGAGG